MPFSSFATALAGITSAANCGKASRNTDTTCICHSFHASALFVKQAMRRNCRPSSRRFRCRKPGGSSVAAVAAAVAAVAAVVAAFCCCTIPSTAWSSWAMVAGPVGGPDVGDPPACRCPGGGINGGAAGGGVRGNAGVIGSVSRSMSLPVAIAAAHG